MNRRRADADVSNGTAAFLSFAALAMPSGVDMAKMPSRKALREVLTAAGEVASLLFVGYEIRQNTIASRASAYPALGIATAQAWDSWAHDRQFQAIHARPPAELSPATGPDGPS